MLLYTGNITSNAFGGLLSAAILTDLNGKRGVAGWRYLFYIEGTVSLFLQSLCQILTINSQAPLPVRIQLLYF